MESSQSVFDVVIIGGGLAGLSAAIHLRMHKVQVLLIEKNDYPKHKVCGEYISNEVLPYLDFLGIDVFSLGATKITKFQLSSSKNRLVTSDLPLGGFGISRYTLDHALFLKAKELGAKVMQDSVVGVKFSNDFFETETKLNEIVTSKIVIGSYGKRSLLDIKLDRHFIKNKSPYLAVKTHVTGNFPDDVVALHNFEGGYCGVSKVEDDTVNICYITDFEAFKNFKDIEEFQEQIIYQNKFLKAIFKETKPVFEAPLTISQISFESKSPVENHILMCGDSAGMIHPLCGNGMSMAIRSAQIASDLIIDYLHKKNASRDLLEQSYASAWNAAFSYRLKVGHYVANIFRNSSVTNIAIRLLKIVPFIIPAIIRRTHGKYMIVK